MAQDLKLQVVTFRAIVDTSLSPMKLLSFDTFQANVSVVTNAADVENQMDVRRQTISEIDSWLTAQGVDRNGIDIFA